MMFLIITFSHIIISQIIKVFAKLNIVIGSEKTKHVKFEYNFRPSDVVNIIWWDIFEDVIFPGLKNFALILWTNFEIGPTYIASYL